MRGSVHPASGLSCVWFLQRTPGYLSYRGSVILFERGRSVSSALFPFMRIALDVMGGDHGCDVVIDGARQALDAIAGITEMHLVGDQGQIQRALAEHDFKDPRVRILHTTEVLTMDDSPLEGVRKKKDCSMVRAIELVRDGKADAIISPGNTGGLVAGSTFRLRRLDGVERPAIAALMPSRTQAYILIDAGANHECKPLYLAQFAVMGGVYSRDFRRDFLTLKSRVNDDFVSRRRALGCGRAPRAVRGDFSH